MEIEHLITVLTVARLKNFNQAALELYCSQSSVSRRIRAAEAELNVTLFQRSSSSNVVQLTPQGELLLPQIRLIIDNYRDLEKTAKLHEQKSTMQLRLGIGEYTFSDDMKATIISKLFLESPELILHLEDVKKSEFFENLTLDKLDAVLFYQPYLNGEQHEPVDFSEDIICIPIAQVRLSVAVGKKHPLAAYKEVSAKMLSKEKFIFNTDTINMSREIPLNQHGMFMKMCHDNGFAPELIRIDRDLVNIKQFLASQSEYVFPSFSPYSLHSYRGICYILVSDAPYYAQYYLMALRGRGKKTAVEKLAELLKRALQ